MSNATIKEVSFDLMSKHLAGRIKKSELQNIFNTLRELGAFNDLHPDNIRYSNNVSYITESFVISLTRDSGISHRKSGRLISQTYETDPSIRVSLIHRDGGSTIYSAKFTRMGTLMGFLGLLGLTPETEGLKSITWRFE